MDVKEAITMRRAYRSFEPVEITDQIIEDFAKCAQIAPSCSNNQPWNFVFVRDKEQLGKLFTTLSAGNKWVEKASMIIGVCAREEADCMIMGRLYYLFDTGLSVAFILLRATELGLVAHPIVGFNEEKAKEIMKIPEKMRLITLINVGKHSKEINPVLSEPMKLGEQHRPPRKPLEKFVFENYYDNPFNLK